MGFDTKKIMVGGQIFSFGKVKIFQGPSNPYILKFVNENLPQKYSPGSAQIISSKILPA